jgi:predicted kinase
VTAPTSRPAARQAGPDLLVLARFEEFTGWLLDRTAKWPKSARFTLTQRIENHALDVVEGLVVARYRPQGRRAVLDAVNLRLERMRHLFRLAKGAGTCPFTVFEASMMAIDEAGRMIHGWRTSGHAQGESP